LEGDLARPTALQYLARRIQDEVDDNSAEIERRTSEHVEGMEDAEADLSLTPLQGRGAMNGGAGQGLVRNNNVGRGKFICFYYTFALHAAFIIIIYSNKHV